MLCIGLYRILFRDTANSIDASSKRYVITNPPDDFTLLPTDQVFVLLQFDPGMEYRPDWGDGKCSERISRTAHGGSGMKKPADDS
jgi:potassium large conductance calcium-activated channel subfamily M alpha protein 1